MLSDEEKKAIKELTEIKELFEEDLKEDYEVTAILDQIDLESLVIALNLIEKQSKEIEELKEDRKSYTEEYIHNNPWLYKQLNENYILRVESEQKERKAWIKGTNDADELCNKKWKDKIKARIKELEEYSYKGNIKDDFLMIRIKAKIQELHSLLEKE